MKNKNNKKTIIAIIVTSVLIVMSLVGGYFIINSISEQGDVNETKESTKEEVVEETKEEHADAKFVDIFNEFQAKAHVKDDYKGQIIFESNLINEPILQGEDNNVYLRRDYETYEYREDGPIFMDCTCVPGHDENIILYGHNVALSMDPNQEQLFTPLHKLKDAETLKDNRIINLIFKDRVETYEIEYIYDVQIYIEGNKQYIVEGEPTYFVNNFTQDEFNEYIQAVKERNVIETKEDITYEDKMLTLQTCYETNTNKLIVVGKLIKSMDY